MQFTVEGAGNARPGLAGRLKALFRETMRCLTRRTTPQPKAQRQRKTEDSGRGFKLAARRILTRIAWTPVISPYEPELWQWNNPDVGYQTAENFDYAEPNHLFPSP